MSQARVVHVINHPLNPSLEPYDGNSSTSGPVHIFRLEKVSMLLVRSGVLRNLVPYGIPDKVYPETIRFKYEPITQQDMETVLGVMVEKFCDDSVDKWSPRISCASLSSITTVGDVDAYSAWVEYLKSQKLEEFTLVADKIAAELALKDFSSLAGPEIIDVDNIDLGLKSDDPWMANYLTYQRILQKPVYQYALPYHEVMLPIANTKHREIPISHSGETEVLDDQFLVLSKTKAKTLTIDDFFETTPEKSKLQDIDVHQLISRARTIGEEPTTIKITGPTYYATQADLDFHYLKSRSYEANFTDVEVKAILDHFSYVVGLPFDEAKEMVVSEGMDLVVEKIEGHPKNKFSNIRPYQIRAIVKDPRPMNQSKPSNMGVVSELTGLVGI